MFLFFSPDEFLIIFLMISGFCKLSSSYFPPKKNYKNFPRRKENNTTIINSSLFPQAPNSHRSIPTILRINFKDSHEVHGVGQSLHDLDGLLDSLQPQQLVPGRGRPARPAGHAGRVRVGLVPQVLGGPVRGKVGVHDGRRTGDAAGAAGVRVAQVEGELLQVVRGELVVVVEHRVVARTAGAWN